MIDFTRPGRMISPSKTRYNVEHPDNEVVFNANLCTRTEKIWWGDIDLTLDSDDLQRFADARGEPLFLLRESDGRFASETTPLLNRAIVTFIPKQY